MNNNLNACLFFTIGFSIAAFSMEDMSPAFSPSDLLTSHVLGPQTNAGVLGFLSSDGKITRAALQYLLHEEGILDFPRGSQKYEIVKGIEEGPKAEKGRFTHFILRVNQLGEGSTRTIFVAKVNFSVKGCKDEIDNLERLNRSRFAQASPWTLRNAGMARLALMQRGFIYRDGADQEQCFILLHAAKGVRGDEAFNIVFSKPINEIRQHFYAIGKSLGLVGVRLSRPVRRDLSSGKFLFEGFSHNDLHLKNFFYDFDSHAVTLIDNEKFGERDPIQNIKEIIYELLFLLGHGHAPDKPGLSNYLAAAESIVEGYVSAYPVSYQHEIREQISRIDGLGNVINRLTKDSHK